MNNTRLLIPRDSDINDDLIDSILHKINCVKIGKIQDVNIESNSCSVEVQYKLEDYNGTIQEFPLLLDVPVFVLQGGNCFIEMPISKGDICLILFNDREIDEFWINENIVPPASTRKHSLSDGFALVGINTNAHPLNLLNSCLRLFSGNKKIQFENNAVTFSNLLISLFAKISEMLDNIISINTVGSSTAQDLNPALKIQFQNIKNDFINIKNNFLDLFGSN